MNQNHNEISPHAYQNSYYQKDKKITSVGEDVKKRKPLYTVGGNVNWYSHYGKQYGGSLKKLKIELHMIQQFHFWVFIQRKQKTLSQKDICTPVFIAALFTIAKIWKQPKCPLMDEQIKKMQYVYAVEYYSAIKKEILPFVTIWMDLEYIRLSKINQMEKDKYLTISLTCRYHTQVPFICGI